MSPPEKEKARSASRAFPNNLTTTSSHHEAGKASVGQLGRRRGASWRLPPLDCGCRDPLHYQPAGVRGYEDAAVMLLSVGLTPAPNLPAMRAMWIAGVEWERVLSRYRDRWPAGFVPYDEYVGDVLGHLPIDPVDAAAEIVALGHGWRIVVP
jgi:hypothetical protein